MATGGRCRRRAVDRAVERKMPGELVLAERQQIGKIAELPGAFQLQRQAALRRYPDRQSRGQYNWRRAAQFEPISSDASSLTIPRHLASLPSTICIQAPRRQP